SDGGIIFLIDGEEKILREGEKNISIDEFKFYIEGGKIKINLNNETVDEISENDMPYQKVFWIYGAVKETGADNAVTSVVFDYRGYDTLGEATILFAAIAGVLTLFRREKK
ncbi:MAG: hydrogen gas-evolving membrane-bound hydrogenase subunit E, partial [Candidatus Thermoplasmatota archaeon]